MGASAPCLEIAVVMDRLDEREASSTHIASPPTPPLAQLTGLVSRMASSLQPVYKRSPAPCHRGFMNRILDVTLPPVVATRPVEVVETGLINHPP